MIKKFIISISFVFLLCPAYSQKDSNKLHPRSFVGVTIGAFVGGIGVPSWLKSNHYYYPSQNQNNSSSTNSIYDEPGFLGNISGEYMVGHSDFGIIGTTGVHAWGDSNMMVSACYAMAGFAASFRKSGIIIDVKLQYGGGYYIMSGKTTSGFVNGGYSHGTNGVWFSSSNYISIYAEPVATPGFVIDGGIDIRGTLSKQICLIMSFDFMYAQFIGVQKIQNTYSYSVTKGQDITGKPYSYTTYYNPPIINNYINSFNLQLNDICISFGIGYQFGK